MVVYVSIPHLSGIPHLRAIAFVRHHYPCSVQGGSIICSLLALEFWLVLSTLYAEAANDGDLSIHLTLCIYFFGLIEINNCTVFFPIFCTPHLNFTFFFFFQMCISIKAMTTKHTTTEHRLHVKNLSNTLGAPVPTCLKVAKNETSTRSL